MIENFIRAVEKALKKIDSYPEREVSIFHHNDSDGLTSGAILQETFRRKGYRVNRYCLEKTYLPLLEKIFSSEGKLIVLADFAGRIANVISELNRGKNLTLIIDHHVASKPTDPMVYNLDPDLFGLKGDRDITASTTCYLFSRTWDSKNTDLLRPAALGAVGDGFFVDEKLVGVNREIAKEAEQHGYLKIVKRDWGEEYIVRYGKREEKCRELGRYLDTLGGVGYQTDGPDIGVNVALNGPTEETDREVERLREIQSAIFEREFKKLREGALKKTKHIQWFNVEDRFSPMGVKMVGLFCEYLSHKDFVDQNKYIAGFQKIPAEIPKFGKIKMEQYKISMRVTKYLEKKIRESSIPGLASFLPKATERLGGFSDACHMLTAATVVDIGKDRLLIEEMERVLEEDFHLTEEL